VCRALAAEDTATSLTEKSCSQVLLGMVVRHIKANKGSILFKWWQITMKIIKQEDGRERDSKDFSEEATVIREQSHEVSAW
jgi:hypothetical protein